MQLFLLAGGCGKPVEQGAHFGGDCVLVGLYRVNAVAAFDGQPVLEAVRPAGRVSKSKRQLEKMALLEKALQAARLLGRQSFSIKRRLEFQPGKTAGPFKKNSHVPAPAIFNYKAEAPQTGNPEHSAQEGVKMSKSSRRAALRT